MGGTPLAITRNITDRESSSRKAPFEQCDERSASMMKTGIKSGAVGVLAALAFSLSVSAEDKERNQAPDPNRSYTGPRLETPVQQGQVQSAQRMGKTQKASSIIGMDVRNPQNEK